MNTFPQKYHTNALLMNVLFEPVDVGESIPVPPPSTSSRREDVVVSDAKFRRCSPSSSSVIKSADDDDEEEAEEERNDEKKFKIQEEEQKEAELYAMKARNECLERALVDATGKENELLIELAHFERACEEKDAIIARLKVDLEEALDAKKREETKRRKREKKMVLGEKTEEERRRRRSAGGRLCEESVSLLEKATSALELARKESEVLRLKLKEEKKKNNKEEETKKTKAPARGERERRRTATPLPETPPFAKQFWSYRNDERRRLAAEERTHTLQFSDEDEDEEEDEEDDFYSDEDEDEEHDEDTFTEVESESHSSSSSSSSSSSEEEEKEEKNYRRDFTNDTTYSSIDELLDRSVVLNSRLEALEQRARHLYTAAKPAT